MKLTPAVFCLMGCLIALAPTGARADILAYEGFDYPEGNLIGQNGGYGWDGGWSSGGDAVVVAGSLAYNDGSTDLPTFGNHALIGGASGSASPVRNMTSNLGLEAGTYWMSFIGERQTPHETAADNFTRAAIFQARLGGTEQFSVGKSTRSDVEEWGVYSGIDIDGTSDYSDISQSELVFSLIKVDIVGGDDGVMDDSLSVWFNPILDPMAALGAPDVSNVGVDDYQFDGFRVFTGGSNASGLYAQMAIDEIRIGTEREDVVTSFIFKEGDTNGDGVVNATDLTPIRTNYRQMVDFRSEGDLNGDGQVTFTDFRQFKTGLLAEGGSLSELNISFLSVPEPATWCLAAIAGLLLSRRGVKSLQ
ncbi:Dockerin type I repeat protein [Pseudobythopirellula maris]|uniref:Dockerin type I repeat protein n=1 Tax=Pseudobythopirellula maris TaxID=2527991 RepID=A0A5C5ZUD2_9BACT|nr:EF-hand domain-containing protein [Pseudobythopirellula maris]TWT90511.1 Dockerin type I repeat protein [Pseudobythopirellula maris]